MDFIKVYLISRIVKKYRILKDVLSHDGFFFLNESVNNIDRIGKGCLFKKDIITPLDWRKIEGKDLLKILNQIKSKEFYFLKEIEGRVYKTRPKNVTR